MFVMEITLEHIAEVKSMNLVISRPFVFFVLVKCHSLHEGIWQDRVKVITF